MDYNKPADVVQSMIDASAVKLKLAPMDLLIRGALSGALLGTATSFAITGAVTTHEPIIGALIFPVGFCIIVILGLELVTGSFALIPLATLEGRASPGHVIINWAWVFLGNLLGSVAYGVLLAIVLTKGGTAAPDAVGATIVKVAQAKTIAYEAAGFAGLLTAFVKAMLCNWLVCLGVVMAMTSNSTIGKIAAAWLPITIFFGQGFEHTVVNMFVIPTGMMMGAKVSVAQWWLWNQIPVTLGNIVGGFTFTGLALYLTHKPAAKASPAVSAPLGTPAE